MWRFMRRLGLRVRRPGFGLWGPVGCRFQEGFEGFGMGVVLSFKDFPGFHE